MASSYPTSLDSLTDPTATDKLNSPSHSAQHADLNDAVEKIQAKVGVNSSAVNTTIDYLLKNTTAGHDHDGTDSKKVVATNLAVTGFTAYQSPRANAGATAFEAADFSYGTINFIIDDGGGVIATGVKGDIVIDFACTITGVTMLANASGSIVVDVWKDSYANYPPTDADSITSATPPTITTATKSQNTTLTNWTTAITAGQILRFNVDSCTTITRCVVALKYRRS